VRQRVMIIDEDGRLAFEQSELVELPLSLSWYPTLHVARIVSLFGICVSVLSMNEART